jgi:hypothetical protein
MCIEADSANSGGMPAEGFDKDCGSSHRTHIRVVDTGNGYFADGRSHRTREREDRSVSVVRYSWLAVGRPASKDNVVSIDDGQREDEYLEKKG